jgi:FKBP-type peptidyl-prolyl cis-trans isomerase FkpA
MKASFALAAAFAAILSLTACGGGGDTKPAVAVSSPATLGKTDTLAGTGAEATNGSRVQVSYTGWLYNASAADFKGTKFESSQAGKPFTFVVGATGTTESAIPGFSQGVQGMKVGGKRTLLIPTALAFGAAGAGNGLIPPNSGLVFEVELLKVCGTNACT